MHCVPWLPVSRLSAEAGVMPEQDIATSSKGLDGSGITGKAVNWISTQHYTRFLGWRDALGLRSTVACHQKGCAWLVLMELLLVMVSEILILSYKAGQSYSVIEARTVLNCWACFVTKCDTISQLELWRWKTFIVWSYWRRGDTQHD